MCNRHPTLIFPIIYQLYYIQRKRYEWKLLGWREIRSEPDPDNAPGCFSRVGSGSRFFFLMESGLDPDPGQLHRILNPDIKYLNILITEKKKFSIYPFMQNICCKTIKWKCILEYRNCIFANFARAFSWMDSNGAGRGLCSSWRRAGSAGPSQASSTASPLLERHILYKKTWLRLGTTVPQTRILRS